MIFDPVRDRPGQNILKKHPQGNDLAETWPVSIHHLSSFYLSNVNLAIIWIYDAAKLAVLILLVS